MVKATKPKLDGEEIGTVVAMIEAWNGPLTWGRLTDRVALVLGRPFSRQALDAHAKIKIAYQIRKTRLRKVRASVRAGKPDLEELPPEVALAFQRAEALQARIDRLQATVDAYDVKFITWLYNARIAGISEDALNSPLPLIDRGADRESIKKGPRR
jgi:hypothetical protein